MKGKQGVPHETGDVLALIQWVTLRQKEAQQDSRGYRKSFRHCKFIFPFLSPFSALYNSVNLNVAKTSPLKLSHS